MLRAISPYAAGSGGGSVGDAWTLGGNATTSTQFLGTTTPQAFAIITNNNQVARFLAGGQFFLGVSSAPTGLTTGNRFVVSGAAAISGADPVAIAISSTTNSAAWSVNASVCALNFHSEDVSGGAGIRSQIAMYAANAQASQLGLDFFTDSGLGLTQAFRVTPTQNVNVGGGQVSDNDIGIKLQVERNDGFTTSILAKQNSMSAGVGIGLSRANNVRSSAIDYRLGTTTEWSAGIFYNAGGASTGYHIGNGIPDATNTKFFINTSGQVGIGTLTPNSLFQVSGSFLWQYRTGNVISSSTVPANFSGVLYYNSGATALTTHTLPAGTTGLTFAWAVVDSDGYRIQAPAGVTIYVGTSASTVGGTVTSTAVGSTIRLVCIDANTWVTTELTGTWTTA